MRDHFNNEGAASRHPLPARDRVGNLRNARSATKDVFVRLAIVGAAWLLVYVVAPLLR